MLKINQIYKVKEGHEGKCGYFIKLEGKFIQIKEKKLKGDNLVFSILDIDKEKIGNYDYHGYFTEDDLELVEEVKEELQSSKNVCQSSKKEINETDKPKSLEDLEVEPIVKLIYLYESDSIKNQTMRKEINLLYTLLEEKLGIKVKIK